MKKYILSTLILVLSLLFFACSFANSVMEDSSSEDSTNFSSVSISAPDFFITDFENGTTNLDALSLSKYYAYKKMPEGSTEGNVLDIRATLYPQLNNENFSSDITVLTEAGETKISSADYAQKDDIWAIRLDSKEYWNFSAGKNYKVSFDAKAETDNTKIVVELKDSLHATNGANICSNLTTEYTSFSFETGVYNTDWTGHLQIALGFFTSEVSIKNLKIQETNNPSMVVGTYLENKNDSVKIQNNNSEAIFTFDSTETLNSSFGLLSGFVLEENNLYEITFNASATDKGTELFSGLFPIDEKYSCSRKVTTIGPKPVSIKMYVQGSVIGNEKYRFASLLLTTTSKTTVTISDLQITKVSEIPNDMDLFVDFDGKYGEITAQNPYVIKELSNDASFSLRFALSTINVSEVNEDNVCYLFGFSKELPKSLTVKNSKELDGIKQTFTNTSGEKKFYKISLDSNWKIRVEESDISII